MPPTNKPGASNLRVFKYGGVAPPTPAPTATGDFPHRLLEGSTDHFNVYYDPDSLGGAGSKLAEGVLSQCEKDYQALANIFGSSMPPHLNVIIAGGIAGAYHYGCLGTDLYCDGVVNPAVDVDHTGMLMIAELAEVCMAMRGNGWNCGASNGEGLSRAMATELYPKALNGFASAAKWLDTPDRPNFVDQTDPGDSNEISYGCATLFLNWLRYQLGYSWKDIVDKGAPTLGQTYTNLAGKNDGFAQFSSRLAQAFPMRKPSGLVNDNPFPLGGPVPDTQAPSPPVAPTSRATSTIISSPPMEVPAMTNKAAVLAPVAPGSASANINIAFINSSTVVGDPEAQNVMAALQKQVTQDFAPVWGVNAQLTFFSKSATPPAASWWLVVLDNTDQAGALGYHDLTDEGLPLGKIFAGTDKTYGTQWSVTASHELLEMLGDPYINLSASVAPGINDCYMTLYAYEVCDACEADEDGYQIDSVLVSDFVYPSWFEGFWQPGETQFDHQKLIQQPFKLRPGGYISVYNVQSGEGWTQLSDSPSSQKYSSRPPQGSRRARRPRHEKWQESQPRLQRAGPTPQLPAKHADESKPAQTATPSSGPAVAPTSAPILTPVQRDIGLSAVIAVGRQQQTLRAQKAADRAQRHATFLSQVMNPTEPPVKAARAMGLTATRAFAPSAGQSPLRILAEGDSWFDYPLPPLQGDGVVYQLQKILGYPINNMAHAGEEARTMMGLAQRQEVIQRLSDPDVRYDALLFSGGGNDLVGDQLVNFLQVAPPAPANAAQVLNSNAIGAAISLLQAEMYELIRLRDQHSEGTIIFVNCYDFPAITGIPVCGYGPWLKPSLDYAYTQMGVGVPDPAQEFFVVEALLKALAQMMQQIAGDANVKDFVVVPTQGTLVADKTDWQNEIHPSSGGFVKIAQKFQAALQAAFP